jgi:hypothetical protein
MLAKVQDYQLPHDIARMHEDGLLPILAPASAASEAGPAIIMKHNMAFKKLRANVYTGAVPKVDRNIFMCV